jgi:hypothetical protein
VDHFGARPITPRQGVQLVLVSELIQEDRSWNEVLIRGWLLRIDAEAILGNLYAEVILISGLGS